jgi:DNA-binding MarR family transcriptional regulator
MNSKSASTLSADAPAPVDFYREESYGTVESIGYMMRRIVTMVGQQIERQLEVSDLTNAQWVPLFKLHIGCATTVAELARECELDAGAMTRLLDRIEAKGLCKRVRSSQDRRVVNLELTAAGHDAARTIPAVLSRVQNANLAGFSAVEFDLLNDFLRRIMQNALAIDAATNAATTASVIPDTGPNPS